MSSKSTTLKVPTNIQMIGQATGKEQSAPWNSILQNSANYFDEDQVPEGFTLIDPSKMKDQQLNEILQFWHQKQKESMDGIGFRFRENSNGQTQKRVRDESEPPVQRKRQHQGPATKSTVAGKGKQKAGLTSSEHWTDHIEPDSRRRQGRVPQSSVGSDSGESFDFTEVDAMASSDEVTGGPEDDLSETVPIPQVQRSVSRNTFGPRSKQQKLGMIPSLDKVADVAPKTAQRKASKKGNVHFAIIPPAEDNGEFIFSTPHDYLTKI